MKIGFIGQVRKCGALPQDLATYFVRYAETKYEQGVQRL
jgi:hypothetical protein